MRKPLFHKSESVVKGGTIGQRASNAVDHGSTIWELLSPESRRAVNKLKDRSKK